MLVKDQDRARGGTPGLYPRVLVPDEVLYYWNDMEPFIERCARVSEGMLEAKATQDMLLAGVATAFMTLNDVGLVALFIARIVDYPTYRSARVISASGNDLKGAMKFFFLLENWAFEQGATQIEGWCRPGMVRLLRRFGFDKKLSLVTLSLKRNLQ